MINDNYLLRRNVININMKHENSTRLQYTKFRSRASSCFKFRCVQQKTKIIYIIYQEIGDRDAKITFLTLYDLLS